MVLKFMWEALGPCVTGSLLGGRCFVFYNFLIVAGNRVSSYAPGERWGGGSPQESQSVCVAVMAVD